MKLKKIMVMVVCSLMVIMATGISGFAATNCSLRGSLDGKTGKATLYNLSGGDRYCMVYVSEYTNTSSKNTVAINSGSISDNNWIAASGTINKTHAQGVGSVYRSASPSSGSAMTKTTQIK